MEKQNAAETGNTATETLREKEIRILREQLPGQKVHVAISTAFSRNEAEDFSVQDKIDIVLEELRARAAKGLSESDRDHIESAVEQQRERIAQVLRNHPTAPLAKDRTVYEKFLEDVLQLTVQTETEE